MGIGWLFNVLFFSDKLVFVAYISTVFIAGQGVIIFVLYVPCSKHVSNCVGFILVNCFTYRQGNQLLGVIVKIE